MSLAFSKVRKLIDEQVPGNRKAREYTQNATNKRLNFDLLQKLQPSSSLRPSTAHNTLTNTNIEQGIRLGKSMLRL